MNTKMASRALRGRFAPRAYRSGRPIRWCATSTAKSTVPEISSSKTDYSAYLFPLGAGSLVFGLAGYFYRNYRSSNDRKEVEVWSTTNLNNRLTC